MVGLTPVRRGGHLLVLSALTLVSCARGASAPPPTPAPSPAVAEAPVPVQSPPPRADSLASPAPPPLPLAGYDVPGWPEAVAAVEEVRGSAGRITVPEALRHARDRRLFLAVQLADADAASLRTPADLAELALMIQRGDLVEIAPLAETHLLYEVGTDAREDPHTHWDEARGEEVPLLGSMAEYEAVRARLAAEAEGEGRAAGKARDELAVLEAHYGAPGDREELFAQHAALTALAANLGGYSYDLSDPIARKRFQARLLSFLRPPARDALAELAQAYHARFGRRLPVSSLIRTQRYQRRLTRVNPNASKLDAAPHTTGMAFDVLYKFMAPDEQNFVMDELARMEEEGRLEALRERRNHIHVYVFDGGQRPPGSLVAGFLAEVEAAHPGSAPRPASGRGRSRARHAP